MAIDAVVFDIGGVLEWTPATGWRQRWARRLGLDHTQLEAQLDPIFSDGTIGRATLAEVEQRLAAALGLDNRRLESFMADLWAEYLGELNEELAAYFAALRPRYATGILSNSFVGARERERERYGFDGLCDVVVYSHEEGVSKPDPSSYAIVCNRLGTAPERAVLLDDTQACVDGARAFGMRAIRFIDNTQAIYDLERLLLR